MCAPHKYCKLHQVSMRIHKVGRTRRPKQKYTAPHHPNELKVRHECKDGHGPFVHGRHVLRLNVVHSIGWTHWNVKDADAQQGVDDIHGDESRTPARAHIGITLTFLEKENGYGDVGQHVDKEYTSIKTVHTPRSIRVQRLHDPWAN